jgi:hypothetical protein
LPSPAPGAAHPGGKIASILFSLPFAGHETTGLIGNTVRRLLEVPDRWPGIVQNPGLI